MSYFWRAWSWYWSQSGNVKVLAAFALLALIIVPFAFAPVRQLAVVTASTLWGWVRVIFGWIWWLIVKLWELFLGLLGLIWWAVVACWVTLRSILLLGAVFAVSFVVVMVLGGLVFLFTKSFSWHWPLWAAAVVTLLAMHLGPFMLELHREAAVFRGQLGVFYLQLFLTVILALVWGFSPFHPVSLGVNGVAFIAIPSFLFRE